MTKPSIPLLLTILWLTYLLSFFHRFAPSGIAGNLAESFAIPATTLGILASVYFYVYTLMQVPTGVINDAFPPRLILLVGGIVAGIGSILFGFATNIEWAVFARLLVGLGVSVTFLSILKIFSLVFAEHRFSTMTGITIFLGNLGAISAGLPLATFANIFGWRTVFIALGFVSLLLAILSWKYIVFTSTNNLSNKNITQKSLKEKIIEINRGLISVIKNRKSLPPALVNGGLAGCIFGFGGLWISPWLISAHQLNGTLVSTLISIFFVGFALGALLWGKLSDYLKNRTLILRIAAFIHLLIFIFFAFSGKHSFMFLAVCLFFLSFFGSTFTLTWSCVKEVNPLSLSGTSTSFANMLGFLIGGVLQVLIGYIIDNQANWQSLLSLINLTGNLTNGNEIYRLPLITFSFFALIGFVFSLFIKETYAKQQA